jgi:hypothetical protein
MRAFVSIVVACALAASAFAHGGEYHGPAGEVPPDIREPIDPPPPPEIDWTSWWSTARDEFAPRRVVADRAATQRSVAERATPWLRELLYDESRNWRGRVAAMTALAKIGDESIVPFAKKIALADAESVRREFRESATLALGLLGRGDAATRVFLERVLAQGPRDDPRVRALAAVSLGLSGDDAAAAALLDALAREEPDRNVKPACFRALGLLRPAAVLPDLAACVRDGRLPRKDAEALSDAERAFAVEALARVGERDVATLDLLSTLVRDRGAAVSVDVRRAAVCALGRWTSFTGDDRARAVVGLLLDVVNDAETDGDTRRLALVALGRRGASAGDAKPGTEIAAQVLRLFDRLDDDVAPFAATALGMIVRAETADERVGARIRRRIETDARDTVRTAFDVVANVAPDEVVDDAAKIEKSVAVLRDPGASGDALRAAALALGEIGDRADVPVRARIATDATNDALVAAITALTVP